MIPKVTFKLDKEKNLWNIWETCNTQNHYGYDFKKRLPKPIIQICRGKTFQPCKKELGKKFRKMHESELIVVTVNSINKAWRKVEKEYFKRLEKIMKKPACSKKFTGYLTFVGRCPYDYKKFSFYFNFFSSIPQTLNTTAHELMHIQFHHTYWKEIEEKIGYGKTSDLKEALTVLLNLEFKDLWFVEDRGYPKHKKLRSFIEKEWKKKKDFNVLLDKCVKYLK